MAYKRVLVSEEGLQRRVSGNDGCLGSPGIVTVATAGALTIGLDAMLSGVARFTGAAGAVAYTLPTGAVVSAALPDMEIGESFTWWLTNTAAQVATLTASAGHTVTAGITTINATSCLVVTTKTAAATFASTLV